jgi:hypothetical protein
MDATVAVYSSGVACLWHASSSPTQHTASHPQSPNYHDAPTAVWFFGRSAGLRTDKNSFRNHPLSILFQSGARWAYLAVDMPRIIVYPATAHGDSVAP